MVTVTLDPKAPIAGARAKLSSLAAERARGRERMGVLQAKLNDYHQGTMPPVADRIDQAAAALLTGVAATLAQSTAAIREELAALCERDLILSRALEMQQRELEKTECATARQLADQLRPKHRELVREMARQAVAFRVLHDREYRMRVETSGSAADVPLYVASDTGLSSLPLPVDGQRLGSGALDTWLSNAMAAGFVTLREVRSWGAAYSKAEE